VRFALKHPVHFVVQPGPQKLELGRQRCHPAGLCESGWAIDVRVGEHRGGNVAIFSGHGEHVSAAERRAPHRDAPRVDRLICASKRDRSTVVVALDLDVDEVSRLPVAVTEVSIVEHESCHPGAGESVGEPGQLCSSDAAETVGHDHTRMGPGTSRPEPPCGAPQSLRQEASFDHWTSVRHDRQRGG